jgi:anti-sigma regulatory factor (Ser/Thr protein kinase)
MSVVQQTTLAAITSATYPGTPGSVPEVRRFVRDFISGSPRAYDLELISAELATNAIRHTPSGEWGGTFTVSISRRLGYARLEVHDLGNAQWIPAAGDSGELADNGHGLEVVAALADEFGHHQAVGQGQVAWAVLTW